MGPDEYHANLNNNYYTNYLLGFIIRQTLAFLHILGTKKPAAYRSIIKKLKVTPAELKKISDLNGKIYLPSPKDGVLEQFSGYFQLRDYKIDRYNEFGIPIINELEYLKDPSHPKYTPTLTHYHEALVKFARTATLIKQADTILFVQPVPARILRRYQAKNTCLLRAAHTALFIVKSRRICAHCRKTR